MVETMEKSLLVRSRVRDNVESSIRLMSEASSDKCACHHHRMWGYENWQRKKVPTKEADSKVWNGPNAGYLCGLRESECIIRGALELCACRCNNCRKLRASRRRLLLLMTAIQLGGGARRLLHGLAIELRELPRREFPQWQKCARQRCWRFGVAQRRNHAAIADEQFFRSASGLFEKHLMNLHSWEVARLSNTKCFGAQLPSSRRRSDDCGFQKRDLAASTIRFVSFLERFVSSEPSCWITISARRWSGSNEAFRDE